MVDRKTCSFCGTDIEPGTGKMYVKKDGTRYNFCSNKCQKNMIGLKRVNRNVRWTQAFVKHPGPTPPKTAAATADKEAKASGKKKASTKKASTKKAAKKAAAPEAAE